MTGSLMTKFRTILADPPWQQPLMGKRQRAKGDAADSLPYRTMPLEEICALPVGDHADAACHCWLWTTNAFLEAGFQVMRAWGFRYLAPVHWIKPSGLGNYVVHRTQTILLGYRERCIFDRLRYFPNIISTNGPPRHSHKPEAAYELIEKVSHGPRLELFARRGRAGWMVWGDQIESDLVKPEVFALMNVGADGAIKDVR
jgi:N6-adenosine-specific RNA methylase IME4